MSIQRRVFLSTAAAAAAVADPLLGLGSLAWAQQPGTAKTEEAVQQEVIATISRILQQLRRDGAMFSPFRVTTVGPKIQRPGNVQWIWASQRGNTAIAFLQADKKGEFRPLGDLVSVNDHAGLPYTMAFANVPNGDALRPPYDFLQYLNDSGSNNGDHIFWWTPVAPRGYRAGGLCFTNGSKPSVNDYYCVREDLCRNSKPESIGVMWADGGQGWKQNGALVRGSANDHRSPKGNTLLTPPLVSALLSGRHNPVPFSMFANELLMSPASTEIALPAYANTISQRARRLALTGISVIPYCEIREPETGLNQSPYYFGVRLTGWECTDRKGSPSGGTFKLTKTTSYEKSEQDDVSRKTTDTLVASVSVQATASADYGKAELGGQAERGRGGYRFADGDPGRRKKPRAQGCSSQKRRVRGVGRGGAEAGRDSAGLGQGRPLHGLPADCRQPAHRDREHGV